MKNSFKDKLKGKGKESRCRIQGRRKVNNRECE